MLLFFPPFSLSMLLSLPPFSLFVLLYYQLPLSLLCVSSHISLSRFRLSSHCFSFRYSDFFHFLLFSLCGAVDPDPIIGHVDPDQISRACGSISDPLALWIQIRSVGRVDPDPISRSCGSRSAYRTPLTKKKIKFFSFIRKFRRDRVQSHIWLTASSCMVKYLSFSSYTVLGSPSSNMTLRPIPSEFP